MNQLESIHLEWFVRDNDEMDEKLPMMAKDVKRRGIDYNQLYHDQKHGVDPDVMADLVEVLDDNLYSFQEMTREEVTYAVQQLWLASILAKCVENGILDDNQCDELF